jgi:hypothetical protein
MGRPINSRYLGPTAVGGGDLTGEAKFSPTVKVGTNAVSETGIIVSQRSETVFVVNDAADGSGNQGSCELVNSGTPGDNEMVITGFVEGGSAVYIRKLQNRTVIDFENNVYAWEIQDDSTANVLVLTQI